MIENTERSERIEITHIERVVMRRVRLIRILALIISTATLAILTFIAALWGIGREVWVARVFQNAPTDPFAILNFYISAFNNTSFIVQALTLLTLTSLIYLIVEAVRLIADSIQPVRTS